MSPAFAEEVVAVRAPRAHLRVIELPVVIHEPAERPVPRPATAPVRRDPVFERLSALAWPAGLAAGAFVGFVWALIPAGGVSAIGRVLLGGLLGIVVARLAVARASREPRPTYRISLRTVERIRAKREALLALRSARAA